MKTAKQPLIVGRALKKIAYSDTPLLQGSTIKELSIQEFEAKFKITYSESLYGNKAELKPYLTDASYHHHVNNQPDLPNLGKVRERLDNPLDCLVICNMGSTGHGLFTSKELSAGTVLFIYAGEITAPTIDSQLGAYDYLWDKFLDTKSPKAVNARCMGNLARFMQHLPLNHDKIKQNLKVNLLASVNPVLLAARNIDIDAFVNELMEKKCTDKELEQLIFNNPETKGLIQESNICISQVVIDAVPLVVCWTQNKITANTQLGFSYGEAYWRHQHPRYFYSDGSVVPESEYHYKQNSLPSMVLRINPLKSYKSGVEHQNANRYEQAKHDFLLALKGFTEKKGVDSIECGNCYTALASTYRDLGDFPSAFSACETAIHIFAQEPAKLDSAKAKYIDCLSKASIDRKALQKEAIENYKDKQFTLAILKLEFILNLTSDAEELGACHSNLASCFREIGEIDIAIRHGEKAVEMGGCSEKALAGRKTKLQELVNLKDSEIKTLQCS